MLSAYKNTAYVLLGGALCKAWQLIFSCFSLCALVKRCFLSKKIHRIREIAQHGAKYKKTTMFYDMIVIRVCPRNRGATTNNLLCECILAQTSSRFLGLPKISFSDLPSWIRETARLIQQRSCAGFTPSFLRPFRRKIRKTLFNCNA